MADYIKDIVFSYKMTTQKEIVKKFNTLDYTADFCIDVLLKNTNFVETYIFEEAQCIISSITHGRLIFERVFKAKEAGDGLYNSTDTEFLSKFVNVFNAKTQGVSVEKVIQNLKLIRQLKYGIVTSFLQAAKNYEALVKQAVVIQNRIANTKEGYNLVQELNTVYHQMEEIEKRICCNRNHAYGVIRLVKDKNGAYLGIVEEIMKPYLRFVYSIAKKHTRLSEEQFFDNFQNGCEGLITSINCYIVNRKTTFASYAKWWIRQAIMAAFKDESNFIKLPDSMWQTYAKLERLRKNALNGALDFRRLATLSKIKERRIQSIYDKVKMNQVGSLDFTVDDDNKVPLESILVVNDKDDEQDYIQISNNFNELNSEEKKIVYLYFGLFDELKNNTNFIGKDKNKFLMKNLYFHLKNL